MVETGSETEEEDKLPASEEDPMINGAGSPASLTNPEASPRAESHGLLTKEEEDEDEMRDSGVEHIWPDNDMLSASVDGTGEFLCLPCALTRCAGGRGGRGLQVSRQSRGAATKPTLGLANVCASCHSRRGLTP